MLTNLLLWVICFIIHVTPTGNKRAMALLVKTQGTLLLHIFQAPKFPCKQTCKQASGKYTGPCLPLCFSYLSNIFESLIVIDS